MYNYWNGTRARIAMQYDIVATTTLGKLILSASFLEGTSFPVWKAMTNEK